MVRGVMSLSETIRRRERLLGFGLTMHNADDPHDLLSIAEAPHSYNSFLTIVKSISRGRCPPELSAHVSNSTSNIRQVLTGVYRKIVKPPVRLLRLGCRAEQVPNPHSRVVLHESKDCFGMPRAHLEWRLDNQDLRSLRKAQQILVNQLGSELALPSLTEGVDTQAATIAAGAHHMGTTRMHPNPKMGVVDKDCRVHDTSNVYVAGSSVFPTGGWAPPTLTIVAMALRLADYLQRCLL